MAPVTRSRYIKSLGSDETLYPTLLGDSGASTASTAMDDSASPAGNSCQDGLKSQPHASIGTSSGNGKVHLAGPGGSLSDLYRLQYDADGEPAAAHDHVHVHKHRRRSKQPTLQQERGSLALLVLLYMIQGVPLGLTTGAL